MYIVQYIPVNWSSPSVVFFRTVCDILYKSENLTSSEVNITLAEDYVGTENIHKEDSEGEHYQGREGALSEVKKISEVFPFFKNNSSSSLHFSGMISGAGLWVVFCVTKVRE